MNKVDMSLWALENLGGRSIEQTFILETLSPMTEIPKKKIGV